MEHTIIWQKGGEHRESPCRLVIAEDGVDEYGVYNVTMAW